MNKVMLLERIINCLNYNTWFTMSICFNNESSFIDRKTLFDYDSFKKA